MNSHIKAPRMNLKKGKQIFERRNTTLYYLHKIFILSGQLGTKLTSWNKIGVWVSIILSDSSLETKGNALFTPCNGRKRTYTGCLKYLSTLYKEITTSSMMNWYNNYLQAHWFRQILYHLINHTHILTHKYV